MANNKSFKVKNGLELEAYNKAISDTAVDVFVYDTRKDSDGGAWRKRTQHTSWYNETLNTATRGSRKEFPAVAVIVAETQQVTIYDGDDPDMPMWMVFNFVGYGMVSGSMNGVTAVNGLFSLGGGANGMSFVDFLKDRGTYLTSTLWNNVLGSIADRHVAKSGFGSQYSTQRLVNSTVNDVAMTVLPNAPIDAATGLPVPTIAVATDAGTSVIRDDGTVVDITATVSGKVYYIDFRKSDNALVYAIGSSQSQCGWWNVYHQVPSSDVNEAAYYEGVYSDEMYCVLDNGYAGQDMTLPLGNTYDSSAEAIVGHVWGSETGFATLDPNRDAPSKGMISYITSTYNTGWMNGDIKLATLSDTDDTDVTGAELVTNGTFAGNLNNWDNNSSGTGSVVYDSGTGAAKLTRVDGNNNGLLAQGMSLVSGQKYVLSFDVATGTTTNVQIRGYISSTNTTGTVIENSFAVSAGNSYGITFIAPSGEDGLEFRGITGTNTVLYLDNISVRLAEEDRSVNGNGLQVFGTVTKNPVASGADLVAYSGFSASNYLEQPYNSDLDFGTGDFSLMGWVKMPTTGSYDQIFARANDGITEAILLQKINTNKFRFFLSGVSIDSTTLANNTWQFITCVRAGGVGSIWVNGVRETSAISTANLNGTNLTTLLGVRYNESHSIIQGNPGSLALLRISATAPSAEQIAKIYEDEKHLFQTGAQATIYGSSDAVTALAYDDSTELLHVGTSAGRSVFQGLRRVETQQRRYRQRLAPQTIW